MKKVTFAKKHVPSVSGITWIVIGCLSIVLTVLAAGLIVVPFADWLRTSFAGIDIPFF